VGKRGDEAALSRSGRKIVQYLNEAHAAKLGLRREIQAQIGATPAGSYRTALERHLKETIRHAERLGERLAELGETRGRVQAGIGTATTLASQLLSIRRVPVELVRGASSEERILRGAKDACAAEAQEIATYAALERLAKDADDRRTAKLAAWIRADDEAMLKKLLAEIPGLTSAVSRVSFDVVGPKLLTRTASGGAGRQASRATNGAREGSLRSGGSGDAARETSVAARRAIGVAREPAAPPPWAGYDELTAIEVIAALDGASEATVKATRRYERTRKRRSTVIQATERELARS
jgi:ferritin-like metal-binding protein YciE